MAFYFLLGNFVEIVLVGKKHSARITLRRSRKCCYGNPPQAENVASDILYYDGYSINIAIFRALCLEK